MRTLPVRYGQNFAAMLDGRCRLAREVRDRLQALIADLGGETCAVAPTKHHVQKSDLA